LAEHCSDEFCKEFVGMVCAVLIEGESKKRPGFWEGYTDNYILVFFPKKGNRDFSNILAPLRLSTLKNSFVISELA
ncbi:MAG TPA: TRAM domain-containing protein, partial [Candidatus Omnitrophota bacterium]|nr:TRAM domain-containing protein [Candidatus Omnitrophota bacterium]